MRFLEGYSDARTQAFEAQERMVNAVPVQRPIDDGIENKELDSTSNTEIPTAVAFEQLVSEVQHDLACLDIDKEERELMDHFISTAKLFASLHFNHPEKDL